MIFINGKCKDREYHFYHYKDLSQLKSIGQQLINEYKQQYL